MSISPAFLVELALSGWSKGLLRFLEQLRPLRLKDKLDQAGLACGSLDWLVDVYFVSCTSVLALALCNLERERVVEVWGCLYVSRPGLGVQCGWGVVRLPWDLTWRSAT